MNFFDAAYLGAMVPLFPALVCRVAVDARFRQSLPQRLGFLPPRPPGGLWVHAASVGEVNAVRPLAAELRRRLPSLPIAVTTLTAAGRDNALNAFPNDVVSYAPFDVSTCVRAAFARWSPSALVIVEQELWPNLILESAVPVLLVNGRMTARSFGRYRRLARMFRRVVRRFDLLLVQTEAYRRRYVDLGADPSRVVVTGNLKFDAVSTGDLEDQRALHRALLNLAPDTRVLVGASTHHPEEAALADAFLALAPRIPDLRLVLAPRHLERVPDVMAMLEAKRLQALRLSERVPRAVAPVTVIDAMGKLVPAMSVATVVFVGGTLFPRGGQNIIEPAALGKPIIVGPSLHNYRDVADSLDEVGAIRIVRGAADLVPALERMLSSPEQLVEMALRAREAVASGRGAAARVAAAIGPWLGRGR
jgi:3-deoxy-D-manno-octulosonic-acid transferase